MSKHTPGPWTAHGYGAVTHDPDGLGPIAIVKMLDGNPSYHADARLIAAAPEMYEALRKVESVEGLLLTVLNELDPPNSDTPEPEGVAWYEALREARGILLDMTAALARVEQE